MTRHAQGRLLRLAADTCTLGVGALGLAALLWRQEPGAFVLLIAAGILDVADGVLARRAGGATDYGRVLDAGSDWIAFGLAPAAISISGSGSLLGVNAVGFTPFGESFRVSESMGVSDPAGAVIAATFLLVATARLIRGLWRPNPPEGYLGLPVPAAAATFLAVAHLPVGEIGVLVTVVTLGWLCWSSIRYPGLPQFVSGASGRVAMGSAGAFLLASGNLWQAVGCVAAVYVVSPATRRRRGTTATMEGA